VDEETLIQRIIEREPNEYWQKKLSDLASNYLKNNESRMFDTIEIDANELSVAEISSFIANLV